MSPALQYRSTELSTLCRRHHVRRLSVFGSAARDEMRTDSDVDLLIEFEAGDSPSLTGFARLKQELEATLGVASIDLATPSILRNPYRRQGDCGGSAQDLTVARLVYDCAVARRMGSSITWPW